MSVGLWDLSLKILLFEHDILGKWNDLRATLVFGFGRFHTRNKKAWMAACVVERCNAGKKEGNTS